MIRIVNRKVLNQSFFKVQKLNLILSLSDINPHIYKQNVRIKKNRLDNVYLSLYFCFNATSMKIILKIQDVQAPTFWQ